MKGQQLIHSFLPGVTVAVLSTQPALANTVKISGVQLVSSPKVMTSAIGRHIIAESVATPYSNLNTTPTEQPSFDFHQPISDRLTSNHSNHIAKSNQSETNLTKTRQKLNSVVVPTSTPVTFPVSYAQQPIAQKANFDNQTLTTISGDRPNCSPQTQQNQAALLLNPKACSQSKTSREWLAQTTDTTTPQPVTPVPTGRTEFTAPQPVTPVPTGTSEAPSAPVLVTPVSTESTTIPENLKPNANPLLYPTKPEEVTVEANQPITLDQAIEVAKRNNNDLQTSFLELKSSQQALREQQASLFPTLDINTDIINGRSSSTTLDVRQNQQNNPNFPDAPSRTSFSGDVQLQYPIFTSGRRLAAIREAEENVRIRELRVESQAEEIRFNVATAYYDLQERDEQVRIAQSAVENAQASLRDAQALERAGVGTRFDVLRSQVNLANAQQDLTNALANQQIGRRRLATLLNIPQSINISAADPVKIAGLWNTTLEQSIILAYQNRTELQESLAQRNISKQQGIQALAATRPQVSLFANYDLLDVFNDSFDITDGYSLGVRATIRLFDGGAARARANQAKTNIEIAETQFAEQRNQIRFQVEQAYARQLSNLDNVQTANAALEQARESLRLARLRFQAGVGTQTDVINAENDLTRAEGNRLTAILNYNRALAELQRSVTFRAIAQ
ncbi:MAG TPA: TolC family protein [Nostocaceae cyanobacterium]|nr:TolC family protein [Nostocaceae cyanobacterium]